MKNSALVDHKDVIKFIRKSPSNSCKLDPIPIEHHPQHSVNRLLSGPLKSLNIITHFCMAQQMLGAIVSGRLNSGPAESSDTFCSLSPSSLKLIKQKKEQFKASQVIMRTQSQSSWDPSSNIPMSQSSSSMIAVSQSPLFMFSISQIPSCKAPSPRAPYFWTIWLRAPLYRTSHCMTLPLMFQLYMVRWQRQCPNTWVS